MPDPRDPHASDAEPARLTGREAEVALAIDTLREAGARRRGVIVQGDVGIGKTTLVMHVTTKLRQAGWRVLVVRCSEAERNLPHVGLQDLLEQLPEPVFEALPLPQAAAIAVVRLRGTPPPGGVDARTTGTAILNVLRHGAETAPTLVVVDDLQWLDRASAAALAFALRRAPGGVRVLAARRAAPGDAPATRILDGVDGEVISLSGLAAGALQAIVRRQVGRALPRPWLHWVGTWSDGNPMFALEIARELVAHSTSDLATAMPAAPSFTALVRGRLRRESVPVRRALLVLAIAGDCTPAELEALARRLHWRLTVPEAADGLVDLRPDGRIGVAHPLLAAEALSMGSPAEVRAIREAVASQALDPIVRARQRALAAETPDASVADDVARAAMVAADRGAGEEALALIGLAVRLTPSDAATVVQQRQLDRARLARRVGDPEATRSAALAAAAGPVRSLTAQALIEVLELGASLSGSPDTDVARRARACADAPDILAAVALALAGTPRERWRHARAASRLVARLNRPALQARAIASTQGAALEAGLPVSVEELDRAVALEAQGVVTEIADSARYIRSWILFFEDDLERSRSELEALRAMAESRGDEPSVGMLVRELAHLAIRSGRWPEAGDLASDGLALAEQMEDGVGVAMGRLQLGAIAALRGQLTEATSQLDLAASLAAEHGFARVRSLVAGRRGQLRLSLDDPSGAIAEFERSRSIFATSGSAELALTNWRGDEAEALVALGRADEAEALVDALEAACGDWRRPVSRAIVLRGRALVAAERGQGSAGLGLALASVDELRAFHEPFELARSLESAGVLHRREGRKAIAARLLDEAIAIYERLGAAAWEQRARRNRQRVGLRPRAPSHLTATELTVARLAASGYTNAEIAGRAYLSTKTVEANLSRVYRKLGIRSRASLGGRLDTSGPPGDGDGLPD